MVFENKLYCQNPFRTILLYLEPLSVDVNTALVLLNPDLNAKVTANP